jgi:flagella basal body P-ring formation protein FlgA
MYSILGSSPTENVKPSSVSRSFFAMVRSNKGGAMSILQQAWWELKYAPRSLWILLAVTLSLSIIMAFTLWLMPSEEEIEIPVASKTITAGTVLRGDLVKSRKFLATKIPTTALLNQGDVVNKLATAMLLRDQPISHDTVDDWLDVPVLTKAVPVGETITAEIVASRPIAIKLVTKDTLMRKDEIIGRVALLPIGMGHSIRQADVSDIVEIYVTLQHVIPGMKLVSAQFRAAKVPLGSVAMDTLMTLDDIIPPQKEAKSTTLLVAGKPVARHMVEHKLSQVIARGRSGRPGHHAGGAATSH